MFEPPNIINTTDYWYSISNIYGKRCVKVHAKLKSNQRGGGNLMLSTLTFAVSSIDLPSIVISISLIDIASLYGVSLSTAGQLQLITSLIGIPSALAVGAISVKYDNKSLLSIGLLAFLIAAISCSFVNSFMLLIVAYSMIGVATPLITPMVFTFIGEFFFLEEKSKAIGTMYSLRTLSYLVMIQVIGYVVAQWGWRQAFQFTIAPFVGIGLLLVLKLLPNYSKEGSNEEKSDYLDGYKAVISSRSALACLIENTFANVAWMGIVIYCVSFIRDRFDAPRSQANLVFSGLVIAVLIGSYVGGWLVSKFGLKNTTVIAVLLTSILIIGFMNMPSYILTLAICPIMSFFAGVILTSADTLTLEQVPGARSTMMSLYTVAMKLAIALGAGIGGLMLFWWNWGSVGISLGIVGIVGTLIFHFFVNESTG